MHRHPHPHPHPTPWDPRAFCILVGTLALACLFVETGGGTTGFAQERDRSGRGTLERDRSDESPRPRTRGEGIPRDSLRDSLREPDAREPDRDPAGARERGQTRELGGTEEGTEEGMPQAGAGRESRPRMQENAPAEGDRRVAPLWLPPDDRQWKLGVYATNTDTGVVITRVIRGSAAWEVGLEPGDRLVSVNGFQIGYVDGVLYPLGTELQRQADRRGNVLLLVQNVRNRRLMNLDVSLDRGNDPRRRER